MATNAVAQRFMANGPSVERKLERRDSQKRIASLVHSNVSDQYGTVRRLLTDAREGRITHEAFMDYVRRTNSFAMVQEIYNWETYSKNAS